MVSAMHAQRADARVVLNRARSLGRRTFVGGPWASSEPEVVVSEADHVLVGEAEDAFWTNTLRRSIPSFSRASRRTRFSN